MPTFPELAPGTVVERYIVLYRLGEGGTASVYAVKHAVLDTQHALKVLHSTDVAIRERLLREGRLQARLDPVHVVPVTDVVEVHGSPALVMPLVEGCSLHQLLQDHRPTQAETAALFLGIVAGVSSAHRADVIHRDLKPANVLLEVKRGQVCIRVADFGLARSVDVDHGRTHSGVVMGTPAYAAPEQMQDTSTADHRADLWSLGVILYELLTGERPFQAKSLAGLIRAGADAEYNIASVPPPWRAVVGALLVPDPSERLQSIDELEQRLQGLAEPASLAVGTPVARAVRLRVAEAVRVRDAHPAPKAGAASTVDWSIGHTQGLAVRDKRSVPPHNLPRERDAFVGREADLDELGRLLNSGAVLVSVLGMGGTGKTRLVTHFGWTQLGEWPGGVWFCDLSEARNVDGICYAVSRALDVALGEDPINQIGHALAGRGRCLILFDNFEQVVRHAPETVGRWLDRATEAQFIVTTREILGLPGEKALALSPLSAVEGAHLFVERARDAKRDFDPAPHRDAIDSLVTLLDRLPLAIELAAARSRVMPPETLLERMSQRFRLLTSTGGRRDRQTTLRGVLDWSWDLLAPDEQAALEQLSAFEGGFTLEAAAATLVLDELWPEDAVQGLVDKSLVLVMGNDRFDLLVSVQEYVAEKGVASGSHEAAHVRHGQWCAGFGTDQALDALARHGGVALRQSLAKELDNLVVACRRAVAREDGAIAAATCRAIWAVLRLQGPFSVGLELAVSVLALPTLEPRMRAAVATCAGSAQARLGPMERAASYFAESLAIYRRLGDRNAEGIALADVASLQRRRGQGAEAWAHLQQALAIAREVGNRRNEGRILAKLGRLDFDETRMDQARLKMEQALAVAREVGDRRKEGAQLGNLGAVHNIQGRPDEARAYYEQALAVHRHVGNRASTAITLGNLGMLFHDQGRMDEARTHLQPALAVAQEVGSRDFEGFALNNLGILCQNQGRYDEARAYYEQALAVQREVGDRRGLSLVLFSFGDLYLDEGELNEAKPLFEQALVLCREIGFRGLEGMILGHLGAVRAGLGAVADAVACFDAGEALTRELGLSLELAYILCYRAESVALTDPEAARTVLTEAVELTAGLRAGPESELGKRIEKVSRMLEQASQ